MRWTRLADADLDDIAGDIGQDSPAAAARVTLELIELAGTLLIRQAAIGRPRRVIGTRNLVKGDSRYVIPYRVRDADIEILRVLHTSRRWLEEDWSWIESSAGYCHWCAAGSCVSWRKSQ